MSAIVVIGCSLGGLEAVRVVIAALPLDFPAPLVLAQHRQPGSAPHLVGLIEPHTVLAVCEAEDKMRLSAGCLYIAPADYHLLVGQGRIHLSTDAPVLHARPSIDVLFESAARAYGPNATAVALTAASEDGAAGALAISRAGGTVVVQDPLHARGTRLPRAVLDRVEGATVLPLALIGPRLAGRGRAGC